ncbi:hypothetical protein WCD74_06355 [Actinomycetospora sp. OC33-EN08]|uniref:Uncharacterized protein n=1 Tax=Actinomycetospora aurantiaca TaxID=3129233 RepID=A0ABU8MK96_9PSEU
MEGRIAVLGRVRLLHDGVPVRLPGQERIVLALLVAAGHAGVGRDEIIDALWPDAARPRSLPPVMSHLRGFLAPVGLRVTDGRGDPTRRLEAEPGRAVTVDAVEFETHVATAERALDKDPAAAAHAVQRAGALWTGTPFDLGATEPPRRVRVARARLLDRRDALVRTWSRAGLRTGTHDVLHQVHLLEDRPDGPDDEDLWLLRVVRALAERGPRGADSLLDSRYRATGRYDDPTLTRGVDLVALAEQGVVIHSASSGDSPPSPDATELHRLVAEAAAHPGTGPRVQHLTAEPTALVPSIIEAAQAFGVMVVDAVGSRPKSALAAGLWSLLLRDRTVDLSGWAALRGGRDDVGVGVLGGLMQRAAQRFRLLVVIDGAASIELVDHLLQRRHNATLLVVMPEAPRPTAPASRTAHPGSWLTAAAVVEFEGRIDPILVGRVLADEEGPSANADAGFAAAVAAAIVLVEDGVHFRDDAARAAALRLAWADPARARRLHRNACVLLQEGTDDDVRRAEHAWQARPLLPDDRVGRLSLAACRAARQSGAPDRAVDLARRALALDVEPRTRIGLLICVGDAHHDRGRMSAAADAFDAAREEADRLRHLPSSSPEQEDWGLTWWAEATLRSARRWSDPGREDRAQIERLTHLCEALADRPTHRDQWLRACAHLAHKSTMALAGGSTGDGVVLAEKTLAALNSATPPETACDVLVEARWALFDHATPSRGRTLSTDLALRALSADSVHFLGEAHVCGVVDLLRLGELDGARGLVEVHRDLVRRHRHGLGPWLVSALDTLFDLWDGRLDSAEARLESDEPSDDASDSLRQTWLGQCFWLRREQGRSDELLAGDVGRLVDRRRFFPVWAAGAALLQADVGLGGPAVDGVEALVRAAPGFPVHGWSVPTLALLAETLDVLDRRRAAPAARLGHLAAEVDRLLAPHSTETVLAGWPTVLLGPVARFRALLALVMDEPGRVPDLLDDRTLVTLPAHQRAWLQLSRLRALDAMGEPGAAELLADAGAVADHHGAVLLGRELDEFRRQSSIRA